jgi:hypothetical protein
MDKKTTLISSQVCEAGKELTRLAQTLDQRIVQALPKALNKFLAWPFRASGGFGIDASGRKTMSFDTIVYTARGGNFAEPVEVPADSLACVIDVTEEIDLEGLGRAYSKIAQAKSLKKSPVPNVGGVPQTTVTLGIIFAIKTRLPIERLAEELDRLNQQTPSAQWPDMMVVLGTGTTVNYAVQFPGESALGDYLPPAEGALLRFTPPFYVVPVVRPAGEYTFNKMVAFLLAHLTIFSPGAKLPNWIDVLDGTPKEVLTLGGYQYNLAGQLVPVPKEFYNDRYAPPPPVHLYDPRGGYLASLQFLPWQDGGVVLSSGKLPLEGLLVFLGKNALKRGGIVKRGDRQLSYVLPITRADFRGMLGRLQKQSNLILRNDPTSFIVQKLADEGSASPFMARLFLGLTHLRDMALPDIAKRKDFDRAYEYVMMALLNLKKTVHDITHLCDDHASKIARGEGVRVQGQTIYVDENIDRELRKLTEDFLNSAVRVLKHGMQDVTNSLHVNIGFLFKKPDTFSRGLTTLRSSDPDLAEYLLQTRKWSERLVECRNAMEHAASVLPRVKYMQNLGTVKVEEPYLSGQPLSEFVLFIMDRLTCFVEEVTAHCFKALLPSSITIAEIPTGVRDPERPERFRLVLKNGGSEPWIINYHERLFENT